MTHEPVDAPVAAAPPKPTPDADSAPYWEALREGRLTFQHCEQCGRNQLYFRAVCRNCWSRRLTQVDASGVGEVYSFSVVHQVGNEALRAETPYALAIVQLEEGPRLVTRIDGDPGEVRIGDRVEVRLRQLDDEITLPHFVKVTA